MYKNRSILSEFQLRELAFIVRKEWKRVNVGAEPYLKAMEVMNSVKDSYGTERGDNIVNYFLSNAKMWQGPIARQVKEELNRRLMDMRLGK